MTIGFNENQVEMDFQLILIDEIIINERIRSEINWQKVKELAESISKIGLINPITISHEKVLIAGLHRLHACRELGYTTIPCRVVDPSTDSMTIVLIEIDENLIRNDLHFIERGEHLLRRKTLFEEKYPETKYGSFRGNQHIEVNETVSFTTDTTNKTGLTKRTIEQEIQLAREIDPEVKEFIKEKDIGKRDALLIAREDREKQLQIVEELIKGNIDVKKTISKIIEIEKREKKELEDKKLLAEKILPRENIVHDSLENILKYLEPNSVDLIVTDPPYYEEYLYLYQELFDKASIILKENSFLITYASQLHLDKILSMKHDLKYVWIFCLLHTGSKNVCHPAKVKVGWKPLLVFVKGKLPEMPYFEDILQGKGREKGLHRWQQALGEAEELIEQFSRPNQLVVDPFLGSGTTIIAAKNTNRTFFGMDIDELAIKTTLRRLGE